MVVFMYNLLVQLHMLNGNTGCAERLGRLARRHASHGQSHETAFAQMISEWLGVKPRR